MSSQKTIKSVTELFDEDFPKISSITDKVTTPASASDTSSSSAFSFLSNITWQTWIIIILILALLGINIFFYLEKGTTSLASIIKKVFGPLLAFIGYGALDTTKQTVEASKTGTVTGVNVVADTITNTIDNVKQTSKTGEIPESTSGTSVGVSTTNNTNNTDTTQNVQYNYSNTSLPVQHKIQQGSENVKEWQEDTLEKALQNAKQTANVEATESKSSVKSSGKAGWCYIGEENKIRTCAEVGVNDICMSGDIFPTSDICINPKLRV